MTSDPFSEFVDGLFDLGALSVQIGMTLGERMLASATGYHTEAPTAAPRARPPVDAEVEAAAIALERALLGNYDLGFQATLRLNFPRDRLRQMAHAALTAAQDAVERT